MAKVKTPKKTKLINKIDQYMIINILIILVVIPLLVRISVLEYVSPTIDFSENFNSGLQGDYFNYSKFVYFEVLLIPLLIMFVYKLVVNKYTIPINKGTILTFGLILLAIVSTVFSKYPTIAFNGILDHFEGCLIYVGYFLLFLIVLNISIKENNLKLLWNGLMIVLVVNFITSIMNFFGYDLFRYFIIKRLITPLNYGVEVIGPDSFIITTLGNQNYLSGLVAAFFSMLLAKILLSSDKKETVYAIVLLIISFVTLLASRSTSGFITIILTLPLVALSCYKSYNFSNLKYIIMTSLIIVIVFFSMNLINNNIWEETVGFLNSIASQGDFERDYIDNTFNLPDREVAAGSGRMYLWTETLKLVFDKPFLGYGFDTLYYYFPNHDLSVYANLGSHNLVTTLPHNFYLNFAFGSGLVSFVLLCLLVSTLFIKGLKRSILYSDIYFKIYFIGWIAFLIQFMFNDSVIGTSVIFWIIFGICYNLNSEKNKN